MPLAQAHERTYLSHLRLCLILMALGLTMVVKIRFPSPAQKPVSALHLSISPNLLLMQCLVSSNPC